MERISAGHFKDLGGILVPFAWWLWIFPIFFCTEQANQRKSKVTVARVPKGIWCSAPFSFPILLFPHFFSLVLLWLFASIFTTKFGTRAKWKWAEAAPHWWLAPEWRTGACGLHLLSWNMRSSTASSTVDSTRVNRSKQGGVRIRD